MSAVGVSESGVRPILAEAVQLARRALLDLEPVGVGAHLGVTGEDESSATHHFEATLPGYHGWQWAVVVAAPPEATVATVSESALLPGPDALVAPDFIPWDQRIRPGDLAPGDLLAPRANDPRLVPGYVATGDPAVDEVALEIGLGRTRVLSREGREEAADRWFSEFGPDTDMARSAPSTCGRCGFYVPLAGSLRAAFGVCGNAMGADGRVVHVAYGCGAHSDVELPTGNGSPLYEAYDDAAVELIPLAELRPETAAVAEEFGEFGAEGAENAAAEAESGDAAEPERAAEGESASAGGSETGAGDPDPASDAETAPAEAADEQTATESADVAAGVVEADVEVTEVAVAEDERAAAAGETEAEQADPGVFEAVDPDAVYDDAWAVTAVSVEPETGSAE
ncbi:DUF3027 domain-containing protein [Nocardia sp. NPDC056611]|uniref:DUF3027 domain-containing protein n=1 Tax=Nocardia sp. NPDC056611 TaxID=3345877 RepID=UPI003673367F